MASTVVSKKGLLQAAGLSGINDVELEDALLQVKCGLESYDPSTDSITVEVNGDRPDLLSRAGLARALAGHLGKASGLPAFTPQKPVQELIAQQSALDVRPFIAGAIVGGVTLDDSLVAELFNQQESLVLGLGRKRRKVSVGACDLSKISFPMQFVGLPPQTKYVPLGFTKPVTLQQVVDQHPKGKEYGTLLKGLKLFPCLQDSKGSITALIPISNASESAITVGTKGFFVDAEGTDEEATNTALSIMCQDFADYGWSVQQVRVQYPHRNTVTPQASPNPQKLSAKLANRMLGVQLTGPQIVSALSRQRIGAKESGDVISALIPAYRGDFIHQADLVEEVAIGYGLNKILPRSPTFFTKGSLTQATIEENYLRDFFVGAGFLELSTHVLTNEARVKKARSREELVEISNPVSSDYHALRGSLLPNLLQVLSENTHTPYPQRIFEVGEVLVPDNSLPERMATVRSAAILSAHSQASLTEVASVALELANRLGKKLLLKPLLGSGQFIQGRACIVEFDGLPVGTLGEIHPQVLLDFGLAVPAAALEVVA